MFNNQNYGCLMLSVDPKLSKNIIKFGKTMVPEKHLYINPSEDINGYDLTPHITLKYGFTTDLTDEHVNMVIEGMNNMNNMVENTNKKKLLLGICGVSCFECKDYDVVKFDVKKDPILIELNHLCNQFPHIDTQKNYHPHITIAYIKKGMFKHTITNKNISVPITGFHYSAIDNTKRYYEI